MLRPRSVASYPSGNYDASLAHQCPPRDRALLDHCVDTNMYLSNKNLRHVGRDTSSKEHGVTMAKIIRTTHIWKAPVLENIKKVGRMELDIMTLYARVSCDI